MQTKLKTLLSSFYFDAPDNKLKKLSINNEAQEREMEMQVHKKNLFHLRSHKKKNVC